MKILPRMKWMFAAMVGVGVLVPRPLPAIQLADGTVYFEQPPSLVYSATTNEIAFSGGATYYFTITVPENAGEPLQSVTIAQRDGSIAVHQVDYDLEDTLAFEGTRRERGSALSLEEVTYDDETQTVTVQFAPPVPAGTTVTIGLQPERNPQQEGTYLFGVTAFPPGEVAHGQFLGYGRFHFYRGGRDLLF